MNREIGKRRDHTDAILARLAHADDAATAHVDAGLAYMAGRVEPLLVGARRDDFAVKLGRCVEVVIVIVEASRLETGRLPGGEHAKRDASLEPKRVHALDHR